MPKEKNENELDSVEDVDVVKHNYSNDDDAKGEQMFEIEMKQQASEEEDVGTKVEDDEVAKQYELNKLLNKPVAFMNDITNFYNVPVN